MQALLEVLKFLVPLVIAAIREAHPDKTPCEHCELAKEIINRHVNQEVEIASRDR